MTFMYGKAVGEAMCETGRKLAGEMSVGPPDPGFDREFDAKLAAQQNARSVQIGGDHYKKYAIQPFNFITANNVPWAEASAIVYLLRWRDKNGVQDLRKARHFIDMLIEQETGQ